MTTHTFTDAELAARDAATRSAALAEAVKWHEEQARRFDAYHKRFERGQSEDEDKQKLEYIYERDRHLDHAKAILSLSTTPPGMVCVERETLEAIRALSNPSQYRMPDESKTNLMAINDEVRALLAAHGGKE